MISMWRIRIQERGSGWDSLQYSCCEKRNPRLIRALEELVAGRTRRAKKGCCMAWLLENSARGRLAGGQDTAGMQCDWGVDGRGLLFAQRVCCPPGQGG